MAWISALKVLRCCARKSREDRGIQLIDRSADDELIEHRATVTCERRDSGLVVSALARPEPDAQKLARAFIYAARERAKKKLDD